MHSQSAQKKPANHKKTSRGIVSKRSSVALSKENNFEVKRDNLTYEKGLKRLKVITPPFISPLSWYGAVCSHPSFCVQQQEFDYSVSYRERTSEVKSRRKARVPNWLVKKGEKICWSRLFSRQNIVLSTYQAFKFTDFNFGFCRNWSFSSDFAQQLRHKNVDVPRIYFTLLDSAGMFPNLDLNQNAKVKEKKLGSFHSLNARSRSVCTHKVLLLLDLCAIYQSLATCQYQRWDTFYNQKLRTQNLLWLHEYFR